MYFSFERRATTTVQTEQVYNCIMILFYKIINEQFNMPMGRITYII